MAAIFVSESNEYVIEESSTVGLIGSGENHLDINGRELPPGIYRVLNRRIFIKIADEPLPPPANAPH